MFRVEEFDLNTKINNPIEYTASLTNYTELYFGKNEVKIHVAPTGSDYNNGTKDKPLATPKKALEILKLLSNNIEKRKAKKYTIVFLKGYYPRDSVLEINSLGKGNQIGEIKLIGEDGGRAVFTGGEKIENKYVRSASVNLPGWDRLNSKIRKKIKMINLFDLGIKNFGQLTKKGFGLRLRPSPLELFINGKPMQLARWPNNSFTSVEGIIDSAKILGDSLLVRKWIKEKNAWAFGYWQWGWAEHYLPISFIDTISNHITFAESPPNEYFPRIGSSWYAFNILEELDANNEYYVDEQNGWLYFIPPPKNNNEEMEIIVSIYGSNNEPFLKITESQNITIENLCFEYSRASGIEIVESRNINLTNCTISNLGTFGISIKGENCSAENLEIYNVGAFGVKLNGGDRKTLRKSNNILRNTKIYNFGRINKTYNPGVAIYGVGQTVKNCELFNSSHSAVIFQGNYHLIEKNRIHNVCNETVDAGAIYIWGDWTARGTEIKHNFIFNITGNENINYRKGIHGIYLDNCASGIEVFGNILYNIKSSGFVNGGGRDNIYSNNIIVKTRFANNGNRAGWSPTFDKKKFYDNLEKVNYNSPPWSDHFPKLARMSKTKSKIAELIKLESIEYRYPKILGILNIEYSSDIEPSNCILKNNVGWKNGAWIYDSKFGKKGVFNFYQFGNNLVNADPMFIDEEKLNLDLFDNSPVYDSLSFTRIPFEEIGLSKVK